MGLTLEDDSNEPGEIRWVSMTFVPLVETCAWHETRKKKSIYWLLFPNVGGYQGGTALPSSGVLAMEFKDLHLETG